MAEISLSAYQDNLSQLSAENKHDEVIAHSRHILKTHPKNSARVSAIGARAFRG